MRPAGGGTKTKRQQTILSLVDRERLASQEDIRSRLRALGLDATQSTISRDVEELGLARVHDPDGLRYVVPGHAPATVPATLLRHALDEFALSFTRGAAGLLLIRTPPGAANALGEALDRAALPEVAGTLAGDDTVLIVPAERTTASDVEAALARVTERKG